MLISSLDGVQYPLGGHRLLGDPDAHRVVNGHGDGGGEGDEGHLGHAPGTIGAVGVGGLDYDGYDLGGHVERGGEEVGAEVRGDYLTIAHLEVFEERVAYGLCQAALDLTLHLLA